MFHITLPYGTESLALRLPEAWVGWVAQPGELSFPANEEAVISSALQAPIDSPPLQAIARPGMRAAILVDDFTRKTPAQRILPPILEALHQAGLGSNDIEIVIALGSHRKMTFDEIENKLGSAIMADYPIIQSSAGDAADMMYLGYASNGLPFYVHRAVAQADLRIGVGMITPHLEAGYSGGAKVILPGVCGAATLDAFHQASAFIDENQLGQLNAPLRVTLEQCVMENTPLHFIINLVLTPENRIYQCVAGHAVSAHRAGAKAAAQVYGVNFAHRYPVVAANCYPYDQDLWQSLKGIYCGDLLVEDGGTLIIATAALEGSLAYPLLPGYIGEDHDALLAKLEARLVQDPKQASTGMMVSRLQRRIRLALVSKGITQAEAQTMGIPWFQSIEEAVAEAVNRLPAERRSGCLAILPQAGVLLPIQAC